MSIDLKPEQQKLLDKAVQSGAFASQSAALDHALAILDEQLAHDWLAQEREAVAAHVEIGYQQALRGELIDGDEAFCRLREQREAT